jgi:hypothetical protein
VKGTWQTTDDGGGLGAAVAAIVFALVIAAVAGPVIAVADAVVRAVLIIGAIIVGLAVLGLVTLIAYRLRHRRVNKSDRVSFLGPSSPGPHRCSQRRREARPHFPRPGIARSTCTSTGSPPKTWQRSSAAATTRTPSAPDIGCGRGRAAVARTRAHGHGGRGLGRWRGYELDLKARERGGLAAIEQFADRGHQMAFRLCWTMQRTCAQPVNRSPIHCPRVMGPGHRRQVPGQRALRVRRASRRGCR